MSLKAVSTNIACGSSMSAQGTWKEAAVTMQQTFCETLGDSDWESYSATERCYMLTKVGYALFGPPMEDIFMGYDMSKVDTIKNICKIIVDEDDHSLFEKNSEIWMAIIFVCMAVEYSKDHIALLTEPVFRVPKYHGVNESAVSFIDRNGRVYKDWKDYLQNNKLPSCSYCYPRNGVYYLNINNQVDIEFGNTPASKLSSKFCNGLDQATKFVVAGSTGVAIAGLAFTISAPIISASIASSVVCGIYGVGRNTKELYDRKKHKESIGIKDSRSRNCWLSLLGNSVGVLSCGASRVLAKVAQSGNTLTMPEKVCVAAVNVTSCTVSGINVANELLNLNEKRKIDDIKPLDVAQLISSVIFFGHSVLSSKAALNLIKEAQQGRLQKIESTVRSNKYRKVFSDFTRNIVGKKTETFENGKIVRSVKYIDEIGEKLLKHMVPLPPEYNRGQESNLIYAGDDSRIMDSIFRFKELILNAARNFLIQITNRFPQAAFKSMDLLLPQNGTTIEVVGPNVRGFLLILLRGLGEFNIPLLLQLGMKIFDDLNYPVGRTLCDVLNIIYMFVKNVVNDMEKIYREELDNEKSLLGPNFSQSSFDQNYNISGKRFEYFCSVTLKSINVVGEIFSMLKDACRLSGGEANNLEPGRSPSPLCTKKVIPWTFGSEQITQMEALQIARDLTKEDLNCNNSVVAYAESEVFVVIEDETIRLNVVKIKCLVESQVIVASVMC